MTRSWRDILAPCLAAESRRTARRSAGRLTKSACMSQPAKRSRDKLETEQRRAPYSDGGSFGRPFSKRAVAKVAVSWFRKVRLG